MKTKVLTPRNRKTDSLQCVYIGPDASLIAIFERQTELARQRYAQVATKVPGLSVGLNGTTNSVSLRRIVIHDTALIAVPAAAGTRVHVDAWPDNHSENTRARGLTVCTLSVDVKGLGYFRVHDVAGLISCGFAVQTADSNPTMPRYDADYIRQHRTEYNDYTVLYFEDNAQPEQSAA